MDWYPRYPTLWRADTPHLTPYQDGCYLRLVDHYMETRQPLMDNDAALARIIGISTEEWIAQAATVVRAFFKAKNGRLFHSRCQKVLDAQNGRALRLSEKGKKGAEIRWNKNNELNGTGIATPLPNDSRGQDRTRQEKEREPLIPPLDDQPKLDIDDPKPKEKLNGKSAPKRSRKPATHIDDGFAPDLDGLKLASDLGIEPDGATKEFIDYWKSAGKPMCDWQAAFRNRLRQLAKYRAERDSRQANGRSNVRDVTGAALRVAAFRNQI